MNTGQIPIALSAEVWGKIIRQLDIPSAELLTRLIYRAGWNEGRKDDLTGLLDEGGSAANA